jgi:hypothetical protein
LKKKKKLKLKALLLGLLMVGGIKLIKLMPVFLALIKLKAIKAIILALISLAISVGGSAGSLIQRKLALFQSSPMKHVKTVEVTPTFLIKTFLFLALKIVYLALARTNIHRENQTIMIIFPFT